MLWPGVALAALVALLAGIVTAPILRTLPEPASEVPKPAYRELATPAFSAVVGTATLVAGVTVALHAPSVTWLAWLSLVGPGVLAVCIDARSTFLPLRLAHASWVIAAGGVVAMVLAERDWRPAAAALIGSVIVGGFFWLVWRVSGGIGFGDVRLMSTVGAVTALHGTSLVMLAVLAGTLLGAGWGVVQRLTRRTREFPYGPGLLAGAFVAWWLQPLATF